MHRRHSLTHMTCMRCSGRGISTMAVGLLGVVYGISAAISCAYLVHKMSSRPITTSWPGVYNLLSALILTLVVELPVAIYITRKATVAVPGIFKYPATLLCCGRRRRAECFCDSNCTVGGLGCSAVDTTSRISCSLCNFSHTFCNSH